MNTKWAMFNYTGILRKPADGAGGDVVPDDGDSLADAFFTDATEAEVAPEKEVVEERPEAEASGEDGEPEAELTEEEKAAKAEEDGDEKEPKDEEDPDAESENVYTVKVDGKEFDVTESELLAGYQRQQDYTQKTQAVATERREFEQQRDAEMAELKNALAYYALPTAKQPNPTEFADNPQEFMQAYGQWQEKTTRQAEAEQLLQQITQAEDQRTLEREMGLLEEAVPEWSDQTKRVADFENMKKAGSERYGFSPEELDQVRDHRLLLLLRDAARVAEFDAKPVVMKRKTEIKPKLSAGTKTKTDPSAEAHDKALKKLKTGKNMSADDLTSVFFQ